jgi:hypothetical protein
MSALARTALRLAGIEALKADPLIAALVGGLVFDSRIDRISQTEPVPVIVVYTEEMEGEAWSANNGGPPFDDHCELVVEIAMRVLVQGADEEPSIWTPETDREIEATLDLIEERAIDALTIGTTAQSALIRCAVTRRISKQKSSRFADPDTGVKLAVRQVTLTAELKGEDRAATTIASPLAAASAKSGNVGNGPLILATAPCDWRVIAGSYTVAFTGATAFQVTDPNGHCVGSGVCFAPFAREVRFTIAAGETPFAAGDQFAIAVTQGPFAALPDPLRTVCEAMPEGSSGLATCQQIAAAFAPPGAIGFFTGADLTVAPQSQLSRRRQAPIEPNEPGSSPSFGATIDIPPDQG